MIPPTPLPTVLKNKEFLKAKKKVDQIRGVFKGVEVNNKLELFPPRWLFFIFFYLAALSIIKSGNPGRVTRLTIQTPLDNYARTVCSR